MDISEIEKQEIEGDLLKLMFSKQSLVEKDFAVIEGVSERLVFGKQKDLHLPEVCRFINDQILWRMVQEINEASVALKNGKTWRETKYFTDINEYKDEIADIMIYIINLCLASGISPEELTQIVLKKIIVNHKRIKSKY